MEYAVIKQLHTHYLAVNSLERTVKYALKKYDIQINRHQLSRAFKVNGFYVKPPNGQPEKHWTDSAHYNNPISHLCATVLDGVFGDIRDDNAGFVDKLTAYAFLGTPRYVAMMGTIGNLSQDGLNLQNPIVGLDIATVLLHREIYDEGYWYWVENNGN